MGKGDLLRVKVRAARLRALGNADDRWEAVALLRAAADNEVLELQAQSSPSPSNAVRHRLEACSLYLSARDPLRASMQWAELPEVAFAGGLAAFAEGGALRAITLEYGSFVASFLRAFREVVGPDTTAVTALRPDQLRALLDTYPGVPELWWALSRCAASPTESKLALSRAVRLMPDLEDEEKAQEAFCSIRNTTSHRLRLTLLPASGFKGLSMEAMGRILCVFGALLVGFAEELTGGPVSLNFDGALQPMTVMNACFVAEGLHPFALEELSFDLDKPAGRADSDLVRTLCSRLAEHRVALNVTMVAPSGQPGLVLDEARQKAILPVTRPALSLSSKDVPQADDIGRVLRLVSRIASREDPLMDVTPRQIAYYRRAAKALGLLSEDNVPTAAGRLVSRLGENEKLAAAVVWFESSPCGDAWIRWSGGRTLLDVNPASALDFLTATARGLSRETLARRAQVLAAWHRALLPHHYRRKA